MKRRDFLRTAVCAGLVIPVARQAAAKPCSPPTFSAVGGSSTITPCVPPPPPPVGMPPYMQGMSDFQVRSLPNVSGGFPTMFAALPAEWKQTGQPNGADNVFLAWSGGAADTAGLRMFVHGGGHNDSSNNGLYVYDFNGDSIPAGWSIAPNSLSALSAVTPSTSIYSDGKPTAIHSYNQLWYDRNLNRFYRFGGSGFGPGGGGISACFYYNFSTGNWVSFLDNGGIGTTLGSTLIGSPDGGKLLYLASTKTPMFVAASGSILATNGSALSGSEESNFVTAMDTRRSNTSTGVCTYVSFYRDPAGPRAKVITVNWPANTWSVVTQTLTGTDAADLAASSGCVIYDPLRDSFWVFANVTDAADGQISSIYEVNAATFAVTKSSLGTPIQALVDSRGGFNRHIWFPNWRIIGTVHAHDQPMSLIKVP